MCLFQQPYPKTSLREYDVAVVEYNSLFLDSLPAVFQGMTLFPRYHAAGKEARRRSSGKAIILSDYDWIDCARMNHGSRASVKYLLVLSERYTTNGEIRAGKLSPTKEVRKLA
jgi:hypothetical protein